VELVEYGANAKLAASAATAGIAQTPRRLALWVFRALDMTRTVEGAPNRPPTGR
jgi:hypothetical protein